MEIYCPWRKSNRCTLAEKVYTRFTHDETEIETSDSRCEKCQNLFGPLVSEDMPLAEVAELAANKCSETHPELFENMVQELKPQFRTVGPNDTRGKPMILGGVPHAAKGIGEGPGTRLTESFKEMGIPPCQACYDLVREMNEWGITKCRENIDVLVADILPRATQWLERSDSWVDRLKSKAPDFARGWKIKQFVETAIEKEEDRLRKKIQDAPELPEGIWDNPSLEDADVYHEFAKMWEK